MARVAGVDLPPNKRAEVGLTYIYGIGRSRSSSVLKEAGVNLDTRVRDLSEDELSRIRAILEAQGEIEGDLRKRVQMDIKRLMDIGCYRGLRHRRSLPVRGQRTHTNARTRKGPRRATIAKKKDAIQRFVDSLIDLSRHYDKDSASWVTAMVPARPDLAKDDLTATTKYLAGRWCVNGCLNGDYLQKTADYIYTTADFAGVKVIPAKDVIDESFVLGAIKSLGAYKGGGNDARQ